MMMRQIVFLLLIESALVISSLILLVQPRFVFRLQTPRSKYVATYSGMVILCLTFCWSVIFGCFLALQDLTVRL